LSAPRGAPENGALAPFGRGASWPMATFSIRGYGTVSLWSQNFSTGFLGGFRRRLGMETNSMANPMAAKKIAARKLRVLSASLLAAKIPAG